MHMGIINITIQPHTPQRYVDLFRAVFASQQIADAGMNHRMFVGRISAITDNDPQSGMAGELYRFFNLDKRSAWLDVATRQALRSDELNRVKDIPDELKPDAAAFPFVFYPKTHRLVFSLKGQYFENRLTNPRSAPSLSASRLVSILQQLFSDAKIVKEFGNVDVTAEPSREMVERLLTLKRLQKLTIELTRPNPDDFGQLERRYLKLLSDQNLDRQTVTLHAATGSGMKLDDANKGLARVAASNGKVEAEGYNETGQRVKESTVDHPVTESFVYNARQQVPIQALVAMAGDFVRRVISARGK